MNAGTPAPVPLERRLVARSKLPAYFAVPPATLARWMRTDPDFPTPIGELREEPVFHSKDLDAWFNAPRARKATRR